MRTRLVRRVRRVRATSQRGAATLELVLATPLLVFCLMLVIQAGLWMHATHVAQTTAQRGLESARAYNGSAAEGHETATQTLHELAGGALKDPSVDVTRGPAQASVEVSGYALTLIPGMRLPVHAHAAGGVERFVPDSTP